MTSSKRQLGAVGNFLVRRLAVELQRQLGRDPVHRALALSDVSRDPDRAPGVVQAALDRLLDPENRVGRELVAAAPVELLRSADQPEHRLLDQVAHGEAVALVAARELDHEPEVRVDQPLLGSEVTLLDPLRELDLLGRGEQGVLRSLVEKELQAVGRFDREVVRIAAPARPGGRGVGRVLASVPVVVCALATSASGACHVFPCPRFSRFVCPLQTRSIRFLFGSVLYKV